MAGRQRYTGEGVPSVLGTDELIFMSQDKRSPTFQFPLLQPGDKSKADGSAAGGTPPPASSTAAPGDSGATGPAFSLFAYPAYDNFHGKISPASWVQAVQARSTPGHQWRVVWDTAAYAPCHPVSLRQVPADFICISL